MPLSRFNNFHVLALLILSVLPFLAIAADNIRLGWQTPWATQGQLVSILQKTNIPQLLDIDLTYVGFSYGGPLNRAALGGQVDVLLTADQPAATLIDKGSKFRVVGRMMYNRTCVYSHPASAYRKLADLGKARLLGPSGAAAERVALKLIREAGVDTNNLTIGDLDMAGQGALIKGGGANPWRGADALYGFDPLPAAWEQTGKIRMLGCGQVVSFIVASRDFVEKQPEALAKFLKAFSLAWFYYAERPSVANAWFKEISGLDIPDEALESAASVEPNKRAVKLTDINMEVSEADHATFGDAVEFLRQRGQLGPAFSIPDAFDMRIYRSLKASNPELQNIYLKIKTLP